MTKKMKIKVTIEWRKNRPAIFANVEAYVKKLENGLYRICAINRIENKKVDVYYGMDKLNLEFHAFEDAG